MEFSAGAELGVLFQDEDFAAAFSTHGHPARTKNFAKESAAHGARSGADSFLVLVLVLVFRPERLQRTDA